MQPIIGRTHTDAYKVRRRQYNIGGRGGINLAWLFADGLSWIQIGVFFAAVLIWVVPLTALGVPLLGWGGMSLALLFGPPVGLAYLADRPLANRKSFNEWVTTKVRHHFVEKPIYAAGVPFTPTTVVVSAQVWSPNGVNFDG